MYGNSRSTELQTKKPHTDVSDRLSQIETHLVNLSNKKPVATSPLPNEFLMEQMHMLEQKINRLQSGQSLQTVKDDTAMEKAPIELKIESLERKILDIINNQHNGQAHNNPEFAEFLEWKKHKSKVYSIVRDKPH